MSQVTADIIFRTILSVPLDAEQANRVHVAFRGYQQNAQRVMGLSALRLPLAFTVPAAGARGKRYARLLPA